VTAVVPYPLEDPEPLPMTVIRTGCPQCAGTLEFSRARRDDVIAAVCAGCAHEYGLSPSGLVPLGRVPLGRASLDVSALRSA
jgi:hypothetical protein